MRWFIGWFWFWFGAGALFLALLPVLIAGRYRLAYGTVLSGLALLLLGVVAGRGLFGLDQAFIGTSWLELGASRPSFVLFFKSGSGGVELGFMHSEDETPENLREGKGSGPAIGWYPSPKQYPELSWPTVFKGFGFELTWLSLFPAPGSGQFTRHVWAAVFPVWLPVPFLLILPSVYLRRRILIPRHRRKHNLCRVCGYSLEGNVSGLCPECATPILRIAKPASSMDGT